MTMLALFRFTLALICLCTGAIGFGPATAAPIDDALAAYRTADYPRATALLRPLAEAGDAAAQAALFRVYWFGKGTPTDFGEALKWARGAAAQNNADGEYGVAMAYSFGLGVTRDPATGLKWLKQAAESGSSDADAWLARHYLYGEGVTTDTSLGLSYLEQAADKGLGRALMALAGIEQDGSFGQPKDNARYVSLLEKAAERRFFPAQLQLALVLEKSDPTRAAMWQILAETTGCNAGQAMGPLFGVTPADVQKATPLATDWDRTHPPVDLDQYDQALNICNARLPKDARVTPSEMASQPVKQDTSGKGAVLCMWSLLVEIEATVDICDLPLTPGDEEIRRQIPRIDKFIIANSSTPVTQQGLDASKAAAANQIVTLGIDPSRASTCSNPDLAPFRQALPGQVRQWIDALVSVPREPLMNPCL